ncbi:MAG: DUF92 domain-containing protein [Anaerococcus sp.]
MNDLILIAISLLYIFFVIGIASIVDKSLKERTELPRKIIHILVGNWIFLGPLFENYWTMIFTPLLFVVLNFFSVKFSLFFSMERQGDKGNFGIVYYAISLVCLSTLSYFTGKWMYAFLGILIMAYGDGLAAIFGIRFGSKNFSINPTKTYEGSFMVFLFGFLITLILPLFYFKEIKTPLLFFLMIGFIIGVYSSILELSGKDGLDNLLLPIGSGLMGGLLIYHFSKVFLLTLSISSVILYFAFKKRAISLDGIGLAILTGAILYICGGIYIYLALIGFFILGSIISKINNTYKSSIKENEFDKKIGRNGIQVLSNSLPAVVFSFIFYISSDYRYLLLAFVIFAGASADTFASEIGSLSKGKVISLIGFKKVPRGLSGGVSLLGVIASLLGALLLSIFAYPEFEIYGVSFCFILGFIGSIIDSVLGYIFQRKYRLKNGQLSDFKESKEDLPVKGLYFVSNNTVNLFTLITIGLIGYLFL